jgi:GNAT superfamily N-acetyltransferase
LQSAVHESSTAPTRDGKSKEMTLALLAKTVLLMLRRGEQTEILTELANRLYSNDASLILRRNLVRPLVPQPRAKIPFQIRPIEHSDFAQIIAERPRRLLALRANIPTCYVATTTDGSICYMQWLISADQQDRLRPYFKGELAHYESETVLLEFAYTFERFRAQGIMAAVMAEIAEQGLLLGARWAITYVKHDNVASLKGCSKAGFRPYMLRKESWRRFRLRQSFEVLSEGTPYRFELEPTTNRPASSN